MIEKEHEDFVNKEIPELLGDANSEETLMEAAIERAAGFISTLRNDADNIIAVLTAGYMNKNLYIVSRAIEK